ncbi:uncharacterized protein K441DRAFT_305502 [Cenococcum geophilum 1.58]|uniref:uncharacterized protein n=1 Tax=Cenococcum geophilum 1.58 TaxID=794803 RepID=UPI00358F6D9C|nr:hypothetical protein K441DRAFT_305502 [Cenococcum geophilum 1.58]
MRTNLSLSQGIMWAVAADFATGTQHSVDHCRTQQHRDHSQNRGPPVTLSRLALSTYREVITLSVDRKTLYSNSQLSSVYAPAMTNDASR